MRETIVAVKWRQGLGGGQDGQGALAAIVPMSKSRTLRLGRHLMPLGGRYCRYG